MLKVHRLQQLLDKEHQPFLSSVRELLSFVPNSRHNVLIRHRWNDALRVRREEFEKEPLEVRVSAINVVDQHGLAVLVEVPPCHHLVHLYLAEHRVMLVILRFLDNALQALHRVINHLCEAMFLGGDIHVILRLLETLVVVRVDLERLPVFLFFFHYNCGNLEF